MREVPPLRATTKDAVDRLDPGERDAVSLAAALDEDTLLTPKVFERRLPMRNLLEGGAAVFGEILSQAQDDEPLVGIFRDDIPGC